MLIDVWKLLGGLRSEGWAARVQDCSAASPCAGCAFGRFSSALARILDGEPVQEEIMLVLGSRHFPSIWKQALQGILGREGLTQGMLYRCLGALLEMESAGECVAECKLRVFDRLVEFVPDDADCSSCCF